MDWKITPIAAAAVLGLAIPASGPARADINQAIGAANAAAGVICALQGGCGRPAPQRVVRERPSEYYQRPERQTPRISAAEQARIAAERQRNLEMQSALDGFGFDVGVPDGVAGPRTRRAISDYQAYMGYPASGELADYQRAALMDSYGRLQAGAGSQYPQVVAAEGTKGLLKAFQDPNYARRHAGGGYPGGPVDPYPPQGGAPYPPQQPSYPPQPAPYPEQAAAPTPGVPQGDVISPVKGGPIVIKPLKPAGQAANSMADRCEFVDLATQANQGPITVSNMSDPGQALSEQFCEARSYAISVTQSLSASVQASEDELVESCRQIVAAMAPVKAALAADAPEAAAARAAGVNGQIGLQDVSAAATYGQICLGLGYRRDDADMALGGGLLLVGAGYMPFGEMLGHHLHEGFGMPASNDAALAWYKATLAALENDAPPVILPAKTADRTAVIRAAVESGQIRASGPASLPALVPASAQFPGQAIVQ